MTDADPRVPMSRMREERRIDRSRGRRRRRARLPVLRLVRNDAAPLDLRRARRLGNPEGRRDDVRRRPLRDAGDVRPVRLRLRRELTAARRTGRVAWPPSTRRSRCIKSGRHPLVNALP